MLHVVTVLRDAVRSALAVELPDVNWEKRTWSKTDKDGLARGLVLTPRVLVDRHDDQDVRRDVTFQIVIKRRGGADINDDIDVDAASVEVAVFRVLEQVCLEYGLTEVATNIDGAANEPHGELSMIFEGSVINEFGDPRTPPRHI